MPSDVLDVQTEVDPSPASIDVAPATTPVVETPAESSPATDVKDESSLSVVRDVIDKRKPESPAPSAEDEEERVRGPDGKFAPKQEKEPDNEHYTDVPFAKHPRFRQLLQERSEFKQDAGRYRNIETFLDSQGLGADEAANALTVAGLMKTDPAKAWEQMRPVVEKLLAAIGEVIPDDLRQRVQAGELTADIAKEISRSRAQVESVQARQTFEQQQAQKRHVTGAQQAISNAVTTWEADRRLKDPNFEVKLVPLQKEIAYLHATEGRPTDAAGVQEQLQKAYKAVNAALPQVNPTQQRRPAQPLTGGQVAGNARPAPESTLEVIRANRRRA